ncbi:MAG: hypothetical protein AAF628_18455 [Planctomycetota bacterium]
MSPSRRRLRGPLAAATLSLGLACSPLAAQAEWQRTLRPGSAYPNSAAYDAARGRLVVVQNAHQFVEVFEWDGQSWHHPRPPQTPPARNGGALVFDPTRQRTVLFGGRDRSATELNDVWEWDGRRWHQPSPAAPPPARAYAGAAFDPELDEIVVHGGSRSAGPGVPAILLGDLWSWNGSRWLLHDDGAGAAPPPRDLHALFHDDATGELVLFGGFLGGAVFEDDTWAWQPGGGWQELQTNGAPSPRGWHRVAFDRDRGVGVLFGQYLQWNNEETWEWRGTTRSWTQVSATPPGGIRRQDAGLIYDGQRIVLFGGNANYGAGVSGQYGARSDLHAWDPGANAWTNLQSSLPPRGRWIMATDTSRNALVAFPADARTRVAWERKDGEWRAVPTDTARPSARWNPGLANTFSGAVLLFGGESRSRFLGDTWRFDGSDWSLLGPGPSPRTESGMTGTPWNGGTVVLFGGLTARSPDVVTDELWLHDSAGWRVVPSQGLWPRGRREAAMAYDPARDRVVLFGGRDTSGVRSNATWEWDGMAWHARTPATRPPAMAGHRLAFDPTTNTCLALRWNGDAWRWDGSDWTQVATCEPFGVRNGAGLGFDPSTGEVVAFGGDRDRDEWTLTTSSRARFETFGVGCPAGDEPALTSTGAPVLGTAFDVDVAWIGLDAALFLLGASRSSFRGAPLPVELSAIGLVDCWLQVAIDASVPATLIGSPAGTARLRLLVPNNPSLLGACAFTQALVTRRRLPGLSNAALLRFGL